MRLPGVPIQLPRLTLDQDTHALLTRYISEGVGPAGTTRKARWHEFVSVGIRQFAAVTEARTLQADMAEVSAVLDGCLSLDLELWPVPPNVDPEYWAEQERDRMSDVLRQLRDGITAASRITKRSTSKDLRKALK